MSSTSHVPCRGLLTFGSRCLNTRGARVVIPGVRRPFGGRTGRAGGRPCPLCLIWWLSTQLRWAPTGTTAGACGNSHGREHVGHEHVGREHVPRANMYRAPTCQVPICTGRQHVGCQLKGANLIPFFSKNTPKLPFLAEEAQMNF
jgi:hypothetical protein